MIKNITWLKNQNVTFHKVWNNFHKYSWKCQIDREPWTSYWHELSIFFESRGSTYRVLEKVEELSIKLQIRWVTVRVSSWNFLWSHWSSFGVDVCNFFNHLKLNKVIFLNTLSSQFFNRNSRQTGCSKILKSNWSHDRIQNNNTFEVMKGFRMAFSFCNVLLKSRYIGDQSEQNWE